MAERNARQKKIIDELKRVYAQHSIDDLLINYKQTRIIYDSADMDSEALRDVIVAKLQDEEGGVRFLMIGDDKYRAAPKPGVRTTVDVDVLRENLPAEVFEEVTEAKVVAGRLAQAHAAGRIPDAVLIAATKEKPIATSVSLLPAETPDREDD